LLILLLFSGQKHPTPTPGFGDRVFYETLLKQRPDSYMAQEWCVAYGVLPREQASQLYKQIMERKKGIKSSSPVPPSPAVKPKKKKIKVSNDDDDPDMPMSGGEGIGRASL
jgi:hypothetical protein